MKKNKESFWDKRVNVFLIGSVIVVILCGINYTLNHLPPIFSQQNPDKCVCEPTEEFLQDKYLQPIPQYKDKYDFCFKKCYKDLCEYRKKTPLELEIDYCNKNPNDSERCECEIWDFLNKKCVKSHPKIECEKLMDKDCDWLFSGIVDNCNYHKRIFFLKQSTKESCQNLKQAWRQKGCEI